MIKEFKIINLFGNYDIEIPFDDKVKILIGENGLGKTTILNILYYILSKKYSKLIKMNFDEIFLKFEDNSEFNLKKQEIIEYYESLSQDTPMFIKRLERDVDFVQLKLNIEEKLSDYNLEQLDLFGETDSEKEEEYNYKLDKFIENYLNTYNKSLLRFAPIHRIIMEVKKLLNTKNNKFIEFQNKVKSFNTKILYFPTYRRVEEDLKNIDANLYKDKRNVEIHYAIKKDSKVSDTLINFGMEDVSERISNIQQKIDKSTKQGFRDLTGSVLSQLLKGQPNERDLNTTKLEAKTVKIVLHRVGSSLPDSDREKILELLENDKGFDDNTLLVYFILKLVDIYDAVKYLDDSIKKFVKVCNKYLENKEFIYNESTIDLRIFRKNSLRTEVLLSQLSSGEKQIISLFSKIYLEEDAKIMVLFDEPELSLSMKWQQLLLPDIIDSNKCDFLLSVTHSPFIFKNKLKNHAVGMNMYINEIINNNNELFYQDDLDDVYLELDDIEF